MVERLALEGTSGQTDSAVAKNDDREKQTMRLCFFNLVSMFFSSLIKIPWRSRPERTRGYPFLDTGCRVSRWRRHGASALVDL